MIALVASTTHLRQVTAQTQLVLNGGFEAGSANWAFTGTQIGTGGCCPRTGAGYAYMGGFNNVNHTLSQSFTIPANALTATLSYWRWIATAETSVNTAFDTQTARIIDQSNTQWLVGDASNLNSTSGYVQFSWNLIALAGQTVTLRFATTNDGSLPTSFLIDDVSVTITQPPPPASPTNLVAVGSANSVLLQWSDNSANETGFGLERKTGAAGAWGLLTNLTPSSGTGTVTYTDANLPLGTAFYYRLYAYNGTGLSQFYTNEAGGTTLATPALSTPADGAIVTSPVTLQWGAVAAAGVYGIDLGSSCGSTTVLNNQAAATNSHTLSLPDGTYVWRVRTATGAPAPGISTDSTCRTFIVGQPCAATLTSPAANSVVRLPQTFSWTTTGVCSSQCLAFAASANPTTAYFTPHAPGTPVQQSHWNAAAAALGPAATYYWTVGECTSTQFIPKAAWRPFTVGSTQNLRVSVKCVLDANGNRPTSGVYYQDSQIIAAIGEANVALANNNAPWRLQLVEIVDLPFASQWFAPTGMCNAASHDPMEMAAQASPCDYHWRSDAMNIYLLQTPSDCGGLCAFPAFPANGNDLIWVNYNGILNAGVGWLHEVGHYLNLLHTWQGAPAPTPCNPDTCTGAGAYSPPSTCADVCPDTHNVMSYNCNITAANAVFSPCQIDIQTAALQLSSRANVIDGNALGVVTNLPVSHNLNVQEGGSVSIGVRLSRQPLGNVTISSSNAAGDTDIQVTTGASLLFTPSNWATIQTMTVSANADCDNSSGQAIVSLRVGSCAAPDSSVAMAGLTVREVDSGASLAAPGGVVATNGSFCDRVRVTWTAVAGANSYKVYRSTSPAACGGTLIGTPTATSLDDTSAAAGSAYYYSVKASNTCGDSACSAYDDGFVATPVAAPTGVVASDGSMCTKTRVTWNSVAGATSYEVYRASADSACAGSPIGTVGNSPFDDSTGTVGVVYYYAVKASNSCGDGPCSATDAGRRLALTTADINGDGSVAIQDIFDFLNAWLGGSPQADFNGDGSGTTQDIFDFLNAWFAGC